MVDVRVKEILILIDAADRYLEGYKEKIDDKV